MEQQNGAPTPEQAPTPAPVPAVDKDVEENKIVAALSYLGIFCLVPLLLKKDSPFCQFHGKQGLILAIIMFVGWMIFWIPIIGWLLWLVVVVVDLVALIKTLMGQKWEIPVIGDLAKKINI